jgi:ABC-2 type transport system permease protein
MKVPNLSHSARIARTEVRRSIRAVRSSTTRTAAFGVALLFWVALPTIAGGFVAYQLGQSLPDVPSAFSVLDLVRGGAAVGWVTIAALAAARSAGGKSELDAPAGTLTTVPARDAALGLLLAEYVRMALVAAIPVLTIGTALAVGAGAVAPLLTIPATAGILLAVSLLLGFPVGIGVKWVTLRSPWLARHKTALLVVAFGLYFLAVTSQALNDAISFLQRALRDTPLAWFGDAALLGLPGIDAVPIYALGAAMLAALLIPALAAVGVRSATTLWYADRAQTEEGRLSGFKNNTTAGTSARRLRHARAELRVWPCPPRRPPASRARESASASFRASSAVSSPDPLEP